MSFLRRSPKEPRWSHSWKWRRSPAGHMYQSLILGLSHPSKPAFLIEIELTQDQREWLLQHFDLEGDDSFPRER